MGRKKKYYHVNRRKSWECPYFKWDGTNFLSCECGRPAFPSRQAANEYMNEHCASVRGWESCSLAAAWIKEANGESITKGMDRDEE